MMKLIFKLMKAFSLHCSLIVSYLLQLILVVYMYQ